VQVADAYLQGVVFDNIGEVLMTDSRWSVVMEFNLTTLKTEVQGLTTVMKSIDEYLDSFFKTLLTTQMSEHSQPLLSLERNFRYEYTVLQHATTRYAAEINSLLSLLPHERRRRGLLDAGGHALRFLFGTLDQSDLSSLNHKIDYLYDTTENIIHNNQEQLTIMKGMEAQVAAHARTINTLVTGLKTYHDKMHQAVQHIVTRQNAIQNNLNNLFSYLKLNAAMNDAKTAVIDARDAIGALHRSVEQLAGGKLSSELITPPALINLLQDVEKSLAPPAELCFPAVIENAHDFYRITNVKAYVFSDNLRVILEIPIKAAKDHIFQIYDVITYPIYVPELHRWTGWHLEQNTKLVISRDRRTYVTYPDRKFQDECYQGALTICPLISLLKTTDHRPTCITDLFLNSKPEHCRRRLWADLDSPIITKTNRGWLYSTSQKHRLTLNCYEGQKIKTDILEINGVGELNITGRCEVTSTAFTLPMRIYGTTFKTIKPPGLVLPAFDSVITQQELSEFCDDLNATMEALQEAEGGLRKIRVADIDLTQAIDALKGRQLRALQRREFQFYVLTGTSSMTLIVILVVLCACRGRIAAWCQRRQRSRREQEANALTQLADLLRSSLVQPCGRTNVSGPSHSSPA